MANAIPEPYLQAGWWDSLPETTIHALSALALEPLAETVADGGRAGPADIAAVLNAAPAAAIRDVLVALGNPVSRKSNNVEYLARRDDQGWIVVCADLARHGQGADGREAAVAAGRAAAGVAPGRKKTASRKSVIRTSSPGRARRRHHHRPHARSPSTSSTESDSSLSSSSASASSASSARSLDSVSDMEDEGDRRKRKARLAKVWNEASAVERDRLDGIPHAERCTFMLSLRKLGLRLDGFDSLLGPCESDEIGVAKLRREMPRLSRSVATRIWKGAYRGPAEREMQRGIREGGCGPVPHSSPAARPSTSASSLASVLPARGALSVCETWRHLRASLRFACDGYDYGNQHRDSRGMGLQCRNLPSEAIAPHTFPLGGSRASPRACFAHGPATGL
jgi:hypothetical protein